MQKLSCQRMIPQRPPYAPRIVSEKGEGKDEVVVLECANNERITVSDESEFYSMPGWYYCIRYEVLPNALKRTPKETRMLFINREKHQSEGELKAQAFGVVHANWPSGYAWVGEIPNVYNDAFNVNDMEKFEWNGKGIQFPIGADTIYEGTWEHGREVGDGRLHLLDGTGRIIKYTHDDANKGNPKRIRIGEEKAEQDCEEIANPNDDVPKDEEIARAKDEEIARAKNEEIAGMNCCHHCCQQPAAECAAKKKKIYFPTFANYPPILRLIMVAETRQSAGGYDLWKAKCNPTEVEEVEKLEAKHRKMREDCLARMTARENNLAKLASFDPSLAASYPAFDVDWNAWCSMNVNPIKQAAQHATWGMIPSKSAQFSLPKLSSPPKAEVSSPPKAEIDEIKRKEAERVRAELIAMSQKEATTKKAKAKEEELKRKKKKEEKDLAAIAKKKKEEEAAVVAATIAAKKSKKKKKKNHVRDRQSDVVSKEVHDEPDSVDAETPKEDTSQSSSLSSFSPLSLSSPLSGSSIPMIQISSSLSIPDDQCCPICFDKRKNTAFSCGHILCDDCARNLKDCPICRARITQRIKLYF